MGNLGCLADISGVVLTAKTPRSPSTRSYKRPVKFESWDILFLALLAPWRFNQKMNLYKYASPAAFYPLAGKMIPWFAVLAAILFAVSIYFGFFLAPSRAGDQNQVYHIIYIHVAAAWMGMFLYVLMAIYAGIGWAFNARLCFDDGFLSFNNRRHVYFLVPGDRIVVGQTNLGNVVGVGCPHYIDSDLIVSLYWVHLPAISNRRSKTCRSSSALYWRW